MAKSRTSWVKYPMKLSKLFNKEWRMTWNNLSKNDFECIMLLGTLIRGRTPHFGFGSVKGTFQLKPIITIYHTGREPLVIKKATFSRFIEALEKEGIIKNDIGLNNKTKFDVK